MIVKLGTKLSLASNIQYHEITIPDNGAVHAHAADVVQKVRPVVPDDLLNNDLELGSVPLTGGDQTGKATVLDACWRCRTTACVCW